MLMHIHEGSEREGLPITFTRHCGNDKGARRVGVQPVHLVKPTMVKEIWTLWNQRLSFAMLQNVYLLCA